MPMIELAVKAGKDATPEELEKFKELVLRDPQVTPNGLSGRIAQAHLLAFLYKDGELIATGAVKCNPEHQAHVAEDSGIPLPQAEYLGEIGYLHTADEHRRRGYGDRVLASLISSGKDMELFATIQLKNDPSQRLLARHGFIRTGKSWPSNQVDDDVNLYIRQVPGAKK
ncbi:GNAT family N-acetyltransferase [Tistrella bauzanensis]|uniref:GNAT family N-acetyltransferase n=2 Tax=Tistrella bauzanensis TaxID=657419 RepID=UPI0035580B9A